MEGKNPSLNRNTGVERARGEFIIFLDDDAQLNENYLRNVYNFFFVYLLICTLKGN